MKKSAHIFVTILVGWSLFGCSISDDGGKPVLKDSRFFPLDENKVWTYDVEYRTSTGEQDFDTTGMWIITEVDSTRGDSVFFSVDNSYGPMFSEIGRNYMLSGDTIYAEVLTWQPGVTIFNPHLIPPTPDDTTSYVVGYSYDFSIRMAVYQEEHTFQWEGIEYEPAWVFTRETDTLKFVKNLGFVYQSLNGTIFTDEGSYESTLRKRLIDISDF